jgi:hypothetical protein
VVRIRSLLCFTATAFRTVIVAACGAG